MKHMTSIKAWESLMPDDRWGTTALIVEYVCKNEGIVMPSSCHWIVPETYRRFEGQSEMKGHA